MIGDRKTPEPVVRGQLQRTAETLGVEALVPQLHGPHDDPKATFDMSDGGLILSRSREPQDGPQANFRRCGDLRCPVFGDACGPREMLTSRPQFVRNCIVV
ncbi:MAG TPA: hypothetical protein DDY14_03615 [Chromatiaceae bacterium]|jgi:hypothetical protein|nr:MAG: hypothetical protein N838_07840 [Thiohalocapsa sp. PB-PSB1]HBG94415.1 hypothetical protein [Chromatiaceae bacterium]